MWKLGTSIHSIKELVKSLLALTKKYDKDRLLVVCKGLNATLEALPSGKNKLHTAYPQVLPEATATKSAVRALMKEVIFYTQRPEARSQRQSAMLMCLQEFKVSFASLVAYHTEAPGTATGIFSHF